MGALPAGKCVRRKALVHQAQGAHHVGIGKFLVEICDLRSEQQSFVDNRARRKRRNIENLAVSNFGLPDLGLRPLSDHVQFALESIFIEAFAAAYKNLLNVRLGGAGNAADCRGIRGCITPSQYREALFAHDALEDSFALQTLVLLDREKSHSHAVGARLGQLKADLVTFSRKKFVRNLNQNAGAIAGFGVAAAGAAMREVDEYFNSLADDLVAFFAANAGYKANAARVMLVRRVVETLRGREPGFRV